MASCPITSWQIDGETKETLTDFIFLGYKITADVDCSHEIKRCLLLGRKALTNLEVKWSEVTQSCPTLCDPMDSLPGSSVHGILQARILEWVAISFSRGPSWPRDRTQVSCIAGRCFTIWATREAKINLDSILKSGDITLPTKVCLVKALVFFSSHVWMWELDYKENWAMKNWCYWTIMLEKTLESPLDCKEIQPVHSIGN